MAASAALDLWLGRGTGFSIDEIRLFDSSPNLDLETAFQPFNGHLILTSRLAYAAILNVFGAGYLPFRLLTIATVLITAGIFFVFAKRRIGPVAAFAPTLVLLFFGSDSVTCCWATDSTVLLPLAAGLGALLALDRGDLKGDVCACLLLCLGARHLFRRAPLRGRRGRADPDRERPLAPSLGVPRPGGALRGVAPLVSKPGWEHR